MEDPHEHTWETTATFRSADVDNEMGVVIDFVAVREAMDAIASSLDGTDLNAPDSLNLPTTSAENVARFFADELQHKLTGQGVLYRLSVTEAPGCQAAYYPGDM
jgi:6-pyruvoyl-tetrahydropterin synthase